MASGNIVAGRRTGMYADSGGSPAYVLCLIGEGISPQGAADPNPKVSDDMETRLNRIHVNFTDFTRVSGAREACVQEYLARKGVGLDGLSAAVLGDYVSNEVNGQENILAAEKRFREMLSAADASLASNWHRGSYTILDISGKWGIATGSVGGIIKRSGSTQLARGRYSRPEIDRYMAEHFNGVKNGDVTAKPRHGMGAAGCLRFDAIKDYTRSDVIRVLGRSGARHSRKIMKDIEDGGGVPGWRIAEVLLKEEDFGLLSGFGYVGDTEAIMEAIRYQSIRYYRKKMAENMGEAEE